MNGQCGGEGPFSLFLYIYCFGGKRVDSFWCGVHCGDGTVFGRWVNGETVNEIMRCHHRGGGEKGDAPGMWWQSMIGVSSGRAGTVCYYVLVLSVFNILRAMCCPIRLEGEKWLVLCTPTSAARIFGVILSFFVCRRCP